MTSDAVARAAAGTVTNTEGMNVTNDIDPRPTTWPEWAEKMEAQLAQEDIIGRMGGLACSDQRITEAFEILESRVSKATEYANDLEHDSWAAESAGAAAMLAVLKTARVVLEVCGAEQRRRAAEGGAA